MNELKLMEAGDGLICYAKKWGILQFQCNIILAWISCRKVLVQEGQWLILFIMTR